MNVCLVERHPTQVIDGEIMRESAARELCH